MAVKRMFSYEELNDMTGEELLAAYNRVAERINRRISRAGGTVATGQRTMRVIKSQKARAEFLKDFKKARVRTVKRVYGAVKDVQAKTQREQNITYRKERREALRRFVRQSYVGRELDKGYKATWVNRLTNAEFDKLMKPLDKYGLGDITNSYEFLYYYYMAHIVGRDIIAVHNKEEMEYAIETAIKAYKKVKRKYRGMSASERALQVAKDVRSGR